jgi:hypothetical protein
VICELYELLDVVELFEEDLPDHLCFPDAQALHYMAEHCLAAFAGVAHCFDGMRQRYDLPDPELPDYIADVDAGGQVLLFELPSERRPSS